MKPTRILALPLLLAFLVGPAGAGEDVMELRPLEEKDISYFKVEKDAGWMIDDETDDVHTLLVCPRVKQDTTLLFVKRTFKHDFLVSFDMTCGSKYKGLEVYVVPPKGDWIPVPVQKRYLSRKGWKKLTLKVAKGKATTKLEEWSDEVEVPEGEELTFALKLKKGSEAVFRKMKIRFLVVSEEQKGAQEGFVRIFDGKSMDGWKIGPDELKSGYKLEDQRIEGVHPDPESKFFCELFYADGAFRDFVLKFKASSSSRGLHVMGRVPRSREEQNQCLVGIDNYFQRDRDWNEVTFDVKGKSAQLRIEGKLVQNLTLPHDNPLSPRILLNRNGKCAIRDIQIKGQNLQPGVTWNRYVRESGGTPSGGSAGVGGRGSPAGGGGGGPGTRTLFNGTDLADWIADPAAGIWNVAQGRILGLTLEKQTTARIRYRKLVFRNYRLMFKVEKGSKGASFIARHVHSGAKPAVLIPLKTEWFTEPWTECEAVVIDEKLTLKVAGKVQHEGKVPVEQGWLGWKIEPNSALGLKDIVWHRP